MKITNHYIHWNFSQHIDVVGWTTQYGVTGRYTECPGVNRSPPYAVTLIFYTPHGSLTWTILMNFNIFILLLYFLRYFIDMIFIFSKWNSFALLYFQKAYFIFHQKFIDLIWPGFFYNKYISITIIFHIELKYCIRLAKHIVLLHYPCFVSILLESCYLYLQFHFVLIRTMF